jgi:acetyl esterase
MARGHLRPARIQQQERNTVTRLGPPGIAAITVLAGALLMGQAVAQSSSPETSPTVAANTSGLHLASSPVAFRTRDVAYLQVDGRTFQATVYQPEGSGPFPVILDVHGGAWVREDVGRDEHALLDKAFAAMGIVVLAIDYRQSAQYHYPDSVVDVNYALRWLRSNASKFNGSSHTVGVFGSSSGGHLVLLNGLRPADPRYASLPLAGAAVESASPDYVVLVYPISDPRARRAYAQGIGNDAPVKSTDIYFSPPDSLQEGNPQLILYRHEPVKLPPVLLIQGGADAGGVVKDTNVSPDIQQRFVASYLAAGGRIQLELLPGASHNFVNMAGPNLDRAVGLMKTFIQDQLVRQ